jgi:hypothetical protein
MDKKEVEHYKNMAREELGLSEDHPIDPLVLVH